VRLGPADTVAHLAVLHDLNAHFAVGSVGGLPERYLDLGLGVGAAGRGAGGLPAEEGASEAVAEKGLEDVLETAELVPSRVAAGVSVRAARHLVPVGVVGAAGLGVGEDLVGLGQLLEAFLGAVVLGVGVGVVGAGQAAVGLLDVRIGGLAGQAQDLVVVALRRQA
jgi:hypothetical protein